MCQYKFLNFNFIGTYNQAIDNERDPAETTAGDQGQIYLYKDLGKTKFMKNIARGLEQILVAKDTHQVCLFHHINIISFLFDKNIFIFLVDDFFCCWTRTKRVQQDDPRVSPCTIMYGSSMKPESPKGEK